MRLATTARLLAALAGLGAAGCDQEGGAASPYPAATSGPAVSAVPAVIVTKVVAQKLSKPLRLPGDLWAYRNVALHAKLQGFVEKIGVDRGSEVKEGQLLVQLVAPEFESQRREAEAKLASDQATAGRLQEAAKTPGVVAGNEVEIALKIVEADQARLKGVVQNEAYLRITAPFDGVITERNVSEGSLAGPSSATPMVRIQEIARLRLTVHLPEAAVGSVTVGDKVKFTVPAFPADLFVGTLARQAFALDLKSRTLPVELDVDNADKRLKPGMFCEVHWEFTRPAPSLFVPSSAVVTTTERKFVLRVKENEAQWVDVRVGQPSGTLIEVFGELAAGDLVAVRGTDEIRDKTKVSAKEPPPAK